MKRNGVYKRCIICQKSFYVSKAKIKKCKYCSTNCYYQARKNGVYEAYWLGKKRPEIKNWLTMFQKGQKPWNTGKKLTNEHRKKLSLVHIGKYLGDKHPNWKGGRQIDERGYVRIWLGVRKWRYEHNLKMEKIIGRSLKNKEIVHHINKNKSDNRIENLMLFPNNKAHIKFHRYVLKDKVKNQYGEW